MPVVDLERCAGGAIAPNSHLIFWSEVCAFAVSFLIPTSFEEGKLK
jgi:hypothetical protein